MSEPAMLCDETTLPTAMADLESAERFVVWNFRRCVLGICENNTEHWTHMWRAFVDRLGLEDGTEALTSFFAIVRALENYGRHTIHHHQPDCPCLGPDEFRIVTLIAACQGRRPHEARALTNALVQPEGTADLFQAAIRFGQFLTSRSLLLPDRGQQTQITGDLESMPLPSCAIH